MKQDREMVEALRGIINSGFNRSEARFIMKIPTPAGGFEPRQFSTWAPQLLSRMAICAHQSPQELFWVIRGFSPKASQILVTAMEQAQVKRLICMTGFEAGDSRDRGGFLYSIASHLLLGRIYNDKDGPGTH